MEIKYLKISDLHPYEKNPRRNDKAVDAIAESIREFGFKVPIVIDKDGVIVAGHARYKASKKLGLTKIPCIVADDLNPDQIKAFRVIENKTSDLAEWDLSLLNIEVQRMPDFDFTDFGFNEAELLTMELNYNVSAENDTLNESDTTGYPEGEYGDKIEYNYIDEIKKEKNDDLKRYDSKAEEMLSKRVIIVYKTPQEEAFLKKILNEQKDISVVYTAEKLMRKYAE